MSVKLLVEAALMSGVLIVVGACGGGEGSGGSDTTAAAAPPPAAEAPAPTPAPADTAAGAAEKPAAGGAGGASPQMIALGDSIFHGQVAGGTCTACHGQDAKGTPVGPNLTDGEWLNTDGTLEGIVKVVTNGVPQPKQAPAPMPPKGGATLSDEQVRAVAAYVLSLSQKS
jgi:mono/diheme cytochrome c family protein